MTKGIYIHIPFCASKCSYCDFNSYVENDEKKEKYMGHLFKEIRLYGEYHKGQMPFVVHNLESIFIGGGTPTVLDDDKLKRIFDTIREELGDLIGEDTEITVEANPKTLTESKLRILKDGGVNRLSIGLQSANDGELKQLGRVHSFEDFKETYRSAREAGFENINIDIIFAVPGQELESWTRTLNEVIALNPTHISAYSLIIEEKTPFGDMLNRGELEEIDEELYISMYRKTVEILGNCGYNQYEISNYARKGYECRHNIMYWKCEGYIGIGAGASGYIGDERYTNAASIDEYCDMLDTDKLPIAFREVLTRDDMINEEIMLALRMNRGLDVAILRHRFDVDIMSDRETEISMLKDQDLIEVEENIIRLTQSGREVSNSVIVRLMYGD